MCATRLCALLALGLCVRLAGAHVQFAFPTSRIDSNYQYTFDGSCEGKSCDAFCGATDNPTPVTKVTPGPLTVTLKVDVLHPPYRYRVSFSNGRSSVHDSGFDTNILLDDIHNPYPNPNERSPPVTFDVTVNIPDVTCEPTCTLHLFDYYYFVSCADIIIETNSDDVSTHMNVGADSGSFTASTSTSVLELPDVNQLTPTSNAAAIHLKPMLRQEEREDMIFVTFEMMLTSKSWVAVALSPNGGMVGSRAVIGAVTGESTYEFDLDGKITQQVNFVKGDRVTESSSFNVYRTQDGGYMHFLRAQFPKTNQKFGNICGKTLIWAHADPKAPSSTRLGYHGVGGRGVFETVKCSSTTTEIPSTVPLFQPVVNHASPPSADKGAVAAVIGTTTIPPSGNDNQLPVIRQEELEDTVFVAFEVILMARSWVAVGLSPDGKMIGSRAVIGAVPGQNTVEFDLNGKSTRQITFLEENEISQDTSFEVEKVDDGGYYVHYLNITFPKTNPAFGNICSRTIIWAHSDPKAPSTRLGYHGNFGKGVFGAVKCSSEPADTPSYATSSSLPEVTKNPHGSNTGAVSTAGAFPMLRQEEQQDSIFVTLEVILPIKSWVAVALSPNGGGMVGSRAVIGTVSEEEEFITMEYDLNGKFMEQLKVTMDDPVSETSSLMIHKLNDGYVHILRVAFYKKTETFANVCDMTILWAHSDPKNPSTELGYHGIGGKGVFGPVECETSPTRTTKPSIEIFEEDKTEESSIDDSKSRGVDITQPPAVNLQSLDLSSSPRIVLQLPPSVGMLAFSVAVVFAMR